MKSLFFVLPALLLGLTACGAPVAAVTLPDTVQVEKTQTAETAVLYEDADGREVSPPPRRPDRVALVCGR